MQVQIPPQVLSLVKHSKESHHRNMFVLVGDESKEIVPLLISISNKLSPAHQKQSILWCYKSDLGFSTNRKKRLKQVKKLKSRGMYNPSDAQDTSFDTFAGSSDIRWCYYKDTEQILGQTYGFLILQDFEALTPNLLARTIETVEGGGSIFFLLKTMDSLKRLYSLTMDVHVKFTTADNKLIRPRFNERFILTLQSNSSCIAMDEEMSLLPLFKKSKGKEEEDKSNNNAEDDDDDVAAYLSSLPSTADAILQTLVSVCKTKDQAKSVSVFTEAISAKTLNYTIALTASRGRGKSASLGLSVACALAYGYSNILVTAPSIENVQTLFEFVSRALVALKFVEHQHFTCVVDETSKRMIRLNVFKTHRQTVQFVSAHQPNWQGITGQAEMLVIDEAAAIPLGIIRQMLGPYLVLMSSTIDGYEGTGRSLSIKLFDELRKESKNQRVFREISLESPIRYNRNDPIERWLNRLLLLDAKSPKLTQGTPHPSTCQLFLLDRDTLFAHHSVTEQVLRRITGLMIASHYKNTPNDLQLLSDAPAHRLFVLVGPNQGDEEIPDILCVAQVAFEGNIPGNLVREQLSQGNRQSGDMLPWTIAQQYQADTFAQRAGARVVRIASHQDTLSMGYGSRMLELLSRYFQTSLSLSSEVAAFESSTTQEDDDDDGKIRARTKLNPLFVPAEDVPPPVALDYLGVSFGITPSLFRFWQKAGFLPLYLRQTENTITGEFSCMMIKPLHAHENEKDPLLDMAFDFSQRFSRLMAGSFRNEPSSLCLAMLSVGAKLQTSAQSSLLTKADLKRLEAYGRNLVDFHFVLDLLPLLAERYFFHGQKESLSALQQLLLVGMGLQHKDVDSLSKELNLPVSQLLAMLNKAIRKFAHSSGREDDDDDKETPKTLESKLAKVNPANILPGTIVSAAPDTSRKREEDLEPEPVVDKKPMRHSAKKHKRKSG